MEASITVVEPGFEVFSSIEGILLMPVALERAGRVCYKSEEKIFSGSADKFIRDIVKSGHESVIEHCSITVKIICDRACSHQLVRHRIAAFSQESQRYCDYKKSGLQVIARPTIALLSPGKYFCQSFNANEKSWDIWNRRFESSEKNPEPDGKEKVCGRASIWLTMLANCYDEYCHLRREGIPPQDARSVLPNATKTEVVTTFNLRQWRHVFEERALNKRAEWQIRGIMQNILKRFDELLPCIFSDQAARLKHGEGA